MAVLLVAAAAVAAIIGTRAALTSGSASASWQSAVREEVKRAAATVENLNYVYTGQAPAAYRVALAGVLADEIAGLAAEASGPDRALLLSEAEAQRETSRAMAEALGVAVDEGFRKGDAYDLPAFLADTEQQYPDLLALDPDAKQRAGDDLSLRSVGLVATTIPASIAFLFGALAQGFERRRRALVLIGFAWLAAAVVLPVVVEVAL